MAATYAAVVRRGGKPQAPLFVEVYTMTCDNSYPAASGGYAIPTEVTDSYKGTSLAMPPAVTSGGHLAILDRANGKIKIGKFADTTEVWTELTNGTNLTGVTVEIALISY